MSKYKIRKTGEIVTVISCSGHVQRSDYDYVSYIDSKNVEHNKEHMNLYWDMEEIDAEAKIKWEQRQFDLAREIYIKQVNSPGYNSPYPFTAIEATRAAMQFIAIYKEKTSCEKQSKQ